MTVLKLDGTKLGLPRHAERVRAWRAGERIAPITIDMALTQKCQMSCVFCVPPEEPVLLANGTWKKMGDIQIGDRVASVDGDRITPSVVFAHWRTSERERLLEIRTPLGILRCTANHPVLTPHGWIAAKNLDGHHIAATIHTAVEGRVAPLEKKDAALVALACGLGAKTQDSGDGKKPHSFSPGTAGKFREDEEKQSHEAAGDREESLREKMDARISQEDVRANEAAMARGENNLSSPEDGRKTRNQQNRIPVVSYRGADGLQICREWGFLDSGMPVWYGEKPGLYLEDGEKQDCAPDARSLLASQPQSGTERLRENGVESVCSVGEEPLPEEARSSGEVESGVMVAWVPVWQVKDAGHSPVYDLECSPHHNFVVSGFVVHNCYANLQQNPAEPVAWEVYENFLDDCVTIGHKPGEGVRAISLVSDGESTLNKFYYRFIEETHKRGIDIAAGTNGEALKKDMMPMLIDKLTYLRINFNAATAAANAKIMGTTEKAFERVVDNIRELVRVKKERRGKLTIGLQMVLMPAYGDQILPLAKFGRTLGVDYFLIKHCSDDEAGRIGVDYSWYTRPESLALLSAAEKESTDTYSVQVKWSKIKTGRDRRYSKCMGTPFLLQLSGTGVVAPCASFFHTRYKERWIGDLRRERWKDIWASDRYWEVINELRSERFDPRVMCETLCLQDNLNNSLFNLVEKGEALQEVPEDIHGPNFV